MDELDALNAAETRIVAQAAIDERRDDALDALLSWRRVDRLHGPDDGPGWAALLRLRDVADRLGAA